MKTPHLLLLAPALAAALTLPLHADTATVTLSPTADARIFDANWGWNLNDGSGGHLGVFQARDRSLLQFAAPVGATVSSANLTLFADVTYGNNSNGEAMNLHRVSSAWSEGTVTWNNFGGFDAAVSASSTANPGATGDAVTWDITSLYSQWASGAAANNGLIIINSGNTNGLHFGSRENGNTSLRPSLTTTFTTPTSAPAGSYTWSGGAGNWSDSNKFLDSGNPVTWADGKDAVLGNGSDTAGTVTLSGTVAPRSLWFNATGSGNYTVSGGTLDFGGNIRIVQTDVDATITSNLSNGGLFKQGSGKLSLYAGAGDNYPNTYNQNLSGGLTVSSGTVELTSQFIRFGSITIGSGATLSSTVPWATGSSNPWFDGRSAGAITVNAGGTLHTTTIANAVVEGLTLNGGSVTASGGANGDWGNFIIASQVTAGGATTSNISAELAVVGAQTFSVGAGSTLNISGVMHDRHNASGGGITKTGPGTLTLSGANYFSGVTNITAGTLLVTNSTGLGQGGHNGATMSFIQDGATLALQGGVSLDEHFHVWGSGVGGLGAVRSISGNNALTNAPGGGAGYALRSTTTVNVEADTLTVSGFYNGDGGSYGLVKNGAGRLLLTANNSYTGGTTVNAGVLEVAGSNGGNGYLRGTVTVNSGAELRYTGGDGTGFGFFSKIDTLNINGGLVDSQQSAHLWSASVNMTGGELRVSGGGGTSIQWNHSSLNTLASASTATLSGHVTLRADAGFTNASFNVEDGAAATDLLVSAAVAQFNGSVGIVKNGAGTMAMTGASTYTGNTSVYGGTLALGSSGVISGSNTLALGGGGTFRLQDSASATFSLVDGGNGSGSPGHIVQTGGTLTVTGDFGENTALRLGHWPSQTSTYQLSGGSLQITNPAGGLALGTDGEGVFTMTGGTLSTPRIDVNHRDGTGSGTFTLNGGTATIGSGGISTAGGPATVNLGGGTLAASAAWSSSVPMNLTGAVGDAAFDTTGGDISLSGVLSGPGGLVKNGSGTLTLSGANTYAGNTSVNGGTLLAGTAIAFGSGNVTVGSGATLDLNGQAIANAITNNGGAIVGSSGSATLAQNGGTLSGSLGGTITATGSVAGSPTFTGTVKGSGTTFTGAVTFANGSTHSPGNSPGVQTFASGVTYDNGSTLDIELAGNALNAAGSNYDVVLVTGGNLTVNAVSVLRVIDFGSAITYASAEWDSVRNFTIVDSSGGGTTSGSFTLDTSLAGSFGSEGSWSLVTMPGVNGDVVLTWTPVPEPSTYAALAGLAALGLAWKRRRRVQ